MWVFCMIQIFVMLFFKLIFFFIIRSMIKKKLKQIDVLFGRWVWSQYSFLFPYIRHIYYRSNCDKPSTYLPICTNESNDSSPAISKNIRDFSIIFHTKKKNKKNFSSIFFLISKANLGVLKDFYFFSSLSD